MFKKSLMMGAIGIALLAASGAARADNVKIHYGMPVLSVAESWIYVAEAVSHWKEQGLDVDEQVLGGAQSTAALVNGDTQFGPQSSNLLVTDAHGQSLIGIASTIPTWAIEIVISNEAAAKTGLTVEGSTTQQRAKALKGLTLAVASINTATDIFLRHALSIGGLDPQKDVVITPLDGSAVNQAMAAHKIDGFSQLSPWTTIAKQQKTGVDWLSGLRGDMPDVAPFAFDTVSTQRGYCEKNADICRKFAAGTVTALKYIRSNPDQALALIAPHFKNMDPELLKAGWAENLPLWSKDGRSSEEQWENTQKVNLQFGIMKPSEAYSKFEGVIYTNAYLP